MGEPIGKQDQYGCAIGGLKFIRFLCNGEVDVEPILLPRRCEEQLNENLLMFYTGELRSARKILQEQSQNTLSDERKYQNLVQMTGLAKDLREALIEENLDNFGKILNDGWMLKREMAGGITNPLIDETYEIAMQSGALGGKLLGAGGGGFLLFYCEKEHQKRLRSALNHLVELPFDLENGGTKVVYVGNKDWR